MSRGQINIIVRRPPNHRPGAGILREAERIASNDGDEVRIFPDAGEIVRGADVVYTDMRVSIGIEKEREAREREFLPYQVNVQLLAQPKLERARDALPPCPSGTRYHGRCDRRPAVDRL